MTSTSNIVNVTWGGPEEFSATTIDIIAIYPGFYTIEATDDKGCISTNVIEVIADYRIPNVSFSGNFTLNCDSIPITLDIDSDIPILKYKWIGPDQFFSNLQNPSILETGIYTISVAGFSDCFSPPFEFEVLYDGELPVFNVTGDSIYCEPDFGNVRVLDVQDDRSVEWQYKGLNVSDEIQHNTSIPGVYSAIVTGVNGCKDTMYYDLKIDTISPFIFIDPDTYFDCGDLSTEIDASLSSKGSNFEYLWSTIDGQLGAGTNTLKPTIFTYGTYTLQITNTRTNCITIQDFLVDSSPSDLAGVVLDIGETKCDYSEDGTIEVLDIIKGHEPFMVSIDGNGYKDNSLFDGLFTGNYLISVRDSAGCVFDTLVNVGVGESITSEIDGDSLINLGHDANLFAIISLADSEISSLEWNVDSLNCTICDEITVSPLRNTLYSYVVISNIGCIDSAQILVRVIQDPMLNFPNIFTPNNDGANDNFIYPEFPSVEFVKEFKIFDNWGSLIFDKSNFDPRIDQIIWDGNFNGSRLNPGVFVYTNRVILKNGEEVITSGNITLIR
jgi:gliding motility-associated-like protein